MAGDSRRIQRILGCPSSAPPVSEDCGGQAARCAERRRSHRTVTWSVARDVRSNRFSKRRRSLGLRARIQRFLRVSRDADAPEMASVPPDEQDGISILAQEAPDRSDCWLVAVEIHQSAPRRVRVGHVSQLTKKICATGLRSRSTGRVDAQHQHRDRPRSAKPRFETAPAGARREPIRPLLQAGRPRQG